LDRSSSWQFEASSLKRAQLVDLPSKIVSAVVDVCRPQARHSKRAFFRHQFSRPSQCGQIKPSGQRKRTNAGLTQIALASGLTRFLSRMGNQRG
jgi:hypothetical protein